MEFVSSLAFSDLSHLVPMARAAEAAGLAGLALSDHLVHPQNLRTPYPYTPDGAPRWPPFTPWPDPWVAISHMAAATECIRFLTSIYVLPARSPVQVAKTVGTASILSGGRVALGVGAGWMREEFELMGQPFAARGRRMNEMLEVICKLWGGGMVEHHGEFFDFEPLEMSPVPEQRIPIYAGGFSPPALRRAATLADGWISDLHTRAELADLIGQVRALRSEGPRAGEPFEVLATCSDAFDIEGYRELESIGVTQLMTMPWVFYGAPLDSLEKKIEGIARFGEDVIERMK